MNGQDLIDYIKKHHLEEAELDISISDPLQFVVTVPETPASNERELVYDFTRDFIYDRYLCTNQISYEEAEKMRDLDLKEDTCLFYDPHKGQIFYLTIDEARRHVNYNRDIYTGRFIPDTHYSKPCLIMEIKEKENADSN